MIEQYKRPYLKVQGKGARERLVGLHPTLARRLRRYIDRERPEDADSDRLLVGRRRDLRTGRYEPLTESGVEQLHAASALRHQPLGRSRRPAILAVITGQTLRWFRP